MSGLEGEAHLVRVDWEQENEPRCTAMVRWVSPVARIIVESVIEVAALGVLRRVSEVRSTVTRRAALGRAY